MARGDTTEAVLAIADQYGVSERTAWRWLASMRAAGGPDLLLSLRGRVCAYCHRPMPDEATIRRRFCSPTCRVRNFRDKQDRQRLAAYRLLATTKS